MANWQVKTPIAFMIFNRPYATEKVFDKIRQVKPSQLLVVADGPRVDRQGEAEKCAAVRAIIDRVDWDCQVLKNYSDINLGCRQRVSSGLDWVFNTVEEAIILEDDCLPDPTFFPFCEELLNRYREDTRIAAISGLNIQFGRKRNNYSYYFSHYHHCWGWASWRRTWQHYDLDMKLWPEIRDSNFLLDILGDKKASQNWTRTFEMTYQKMLDTWDYQFGLACWLQSGLTILPNVNLIANIGYGEGGTNTNDESSIYGNMVVEALDFPLSHPPFIIRDAQADRYTESTIYNYHPVLWKRVWRKLKKLFNHLGTK